MGVLKQIMQWLKAHSGLLKLIFFGSILVFVVNQVAHIAQGMSWQDIGKIMGQQNRWILLAMVAVGSAGVLPMLLYDYVTIGILEEEGKPHMPRREWFVSAWITNTINNLAGFGGVVGATLRANFYGKDIERKKVIVTVSKVALFMLSGLSILSFITFVDIFFVRASPYREYWIWLLGGSLYAPALFLFTQLKRRSIFRNFFPKGVFLLFGASSGQWLGAMFSFLAIGKLMNVPIALHNVYPLFVVATLIGMLTMVPGGVGTFDILMILGLSRVGVTESIAVVWLLYYRLFYYVVPFATGLILFLHQTSVKINTFFDNLPRLFSQKLAQSLLVLALYFAGIMMVLLSTVTNLSNTSAFFRILLPYSFDFFDQTLNMIVGFLLLGLARGISLKVKKAYWPTIGFLAFCILNTITRTTSWQLIVVYVLIMLAVFLARKELYREKFVYSWGALALDGLIFGLLFVLYAVAGYYSAGGQNRTANFLLFPSDDIWFKGLIGIGISLISLVLLYQYLTNSNRELGESYDAERLTALLDRFGGNADSQLLYLRDYRYYYYRSEQADQVLFAFQFKANKCFMAGDPIGDRALWSEALLAFMTEADHLGYQPAFYGISDEFVMVLHDHGYEFMKVGEEGIIDFQNADLDLVAISPENTRMKQLENQGYTFTMYDTISDELMRELKRVSNDWLGNRKERNFATGYFDEDYLRRNPVGVVRDSEHAFVGFLSIKSLQQPGWISYDLLRYRSTAPEGIDYFLLTNFIAYYRRRDIRWVDMHIAPLANVGENPYSFFEERLVNIFYKYGYQIYGFQGTRKQMERYVTNWEPRYFAYSKNCSVLIALAQVLLLIGRGSSSNTLVEEAMIEI